MKYKILSVVFLLSFFLACNDSNNDLNESKPDIDLTQLKQYFGTRKIDYSFSDGILSMNILDPKFKVEANVPLEKRIQDYSTQGALIFVNKTKGIVIDSLRMKFQVDSKDINVSYSCADLRLIDENVTRSVDFMKKVSERKYSEANTYLDNSIAENEGEILKTYETINSLGSIDSYRFVKFKIRNDNVAILINAIYKTGDINTYVLVFSLKKPNNSKIIGLSTKA